MIRWPASLTPIARENLERFRATSAAAALEAAPDEWIVENWTWTREPPLHVRLRDPKLVEIDFTMGDDGMWRLDAAPIETHLPPMAEIPDEDPQRVIR